MLNSLKKSIIFVLYFSFFSYWIVNWNSDWTNILTDKPFIERIEVVWDIISFYWTGFQDFKEIEWYLWNEKLKIRSNPKYDLVQFYNNYKSWSAKIILKRQFNANKTTLTSYNSNSINVFQNELNYIKFANYEKQWEKIKIEISLYDYVPISKLVVYVNDKTFKWKDLIVDWKKITLYYEYWKNTISNPNFEIRVYADKIQLNSYFIFNWYSNTISLKEITKHSEEEIWIRLNTSNDNFTKLFLDWKELSSTFYKVNDDEILIKLQIKSIKSKFKIFTKSDEWVSNLILIDVSERVYPIIEKVEVDWFITTWTYMKIYWNNLWIKNSDIKIIINWKSYNVSWKESSTYLNDWTINNFEYNQWYYYELLFPFSLKSKTYLTLQTKVKNNLSNIVKLNNNQITKNWNYIFSWKTLFNTSSISLNFSTNEFSWTYYPTSNSSYKKLDIWKLKIDFTWDNDIFVNNIKFIINTDKELSYLPFWKIKLWNYIWYIKKTWKSEYELYFYNIDINKKTSKSLNLSIEFIQSDENFSFNIYWEDYEYFSKTSFQYAKTTKSLNNISENENDDIFLWFNKAVCFDYYKDYRSCKTRNFNSNSYIKFFSY